MPAAFNAVIGFPNWTDYVTWSGGSYVAAYPVTNFNILPLAKVARTTDLLAASLIAIGTLDRVRGIRLVTFHGDNMTLQAQVRLRIYAEAARTTLLYDSGWVDRWPAVYPFAGNAGAPEWYETNFWDSKYTAEQLSDTTWMYAFWLDSVYPGRAFTLEFSDAANAAGYVQVGYATVSSGTQVSINYEPGAESGFRYRSIRQEGIGGVQGFERRNKPRQIVAQIPQLYRSEAMALHFERLRRLDIDKPFVWLPWPDDPTKMLQEAFLARNMDQGSRIRESAFNSMAVPLPFEEVL